MFPDVPSFQRWIKVFTGISPSMDALTGLMCDLTFCLTWWDIRKKPASNQPAYYDGHWDSHCCKWICYNEKIWTRVDSKYLVAQGSMVNILHKTTWGCHQLKMSIVIRNAIKNMLNIWQIMVHITFFFICINLTIIIVIFSQWNISDKEGEKRWQRISRRMKTTEYRRLGQDSCWRGGRLDPPGTSTHLHHPI